MLVATSGCFDILHAGHVHLLTHARSLGDSLIVLLNSDDSVRRLKGGGRPINSQESRRYVLESLSCVDQVIVFDEDTPCDLLFKIKPDIFVKEAEYRGKDIPEVQIMNNLGGSVYYIERQFDVSTSKLLKAVEDNYD